MFELELELEQKKYINELNSHKFNSFRIFFSRQQKMKKNKKKKMKFSLTLPLFPIIFDYNFVFPFLNFIFLRWRNKISVYTFFISSRIYSTYKKIETQRLGRQGVFRKKKKSEKKLWNGTLNSNSTFFLYLGWRWRRSRTNLI